MSPSGIYAQSAVHDGAGGRILQMGFFIGVEVLLHAKGCQCRFVDKIRCKGVKVPEGLFVPPAGVEAAPRKA